MPPADPAEPRLVVDAHSHLMPAELIEFFRGGNHPAVSVEEAGEGPPWLVHDQGLRFPWAPAFHDLEAKLEQMDRDGIDVALQSIAPPYFLYELPADQTAELAATFNQAVSRQAAESGGRIRGLATVALNDPPAAAAELERARRELGLVGVEIGTCVGPTMLDAPELDPFFAAAERLGMPVMIHPHASMLGESLPLGLDRYFLSNLLGNALETTRAASRLILGGVLDRHPELTVHLVHGGGYFPYQLGRLQRGYELIEPVREVAQRPPRDYLDSFLIDTVLYDLAAVRALVALAGAERVIFGTDGPFGFVDVTGLRVGELVEPPAAAEVLAANAIRAYGLADERERGDGNA